MRLLRCAQIIFALVEQALKAYDVSQFGVAENLFGTGAFWFSILVCGLVSFGHRYVERALVWLFHPQVPLLLNPFSSPLAPHTTHPSLVAPPLPLKQSHAAAVTCHKSCSKHKSPTAHQPMHLSPLPSPCPGRS